MKIKRFQARTMREALHKVREEQGPDSVILSKQRVADGIEVIAAVDYDQALLYQSNQHQSNQHLGQTNNTTAENKAELNVEDHHSEAKNSTPTGAADTAAAETGRTLGNFFTRAYASTSSLDGAEAHGAEAHGAEAHGAAHGAEASPDDAFDPDFPGSGPGASAQTQSASGSSPENTELRSVFDEAATIATLREPTTSPTTVDNVALESLASQLNNLQENLERKFVELHWDELQRREPQLAEVIRRLDLLGLGRPLIQAIVRSLSPEDNQKKAWRNAIGLLAKRIPINTHDICDEGGIFAIVGPTGAGKTTTIAKLAARFALEHGPQAIGLITTDSYRIGAQEHLLRFGKILGVPVQVAGNAAMLRATLDQLADKKLVLIDTAGFSPRDDAMFSNLADLTRHSPTVQTLLALPANMQTAGLRQAIRTFGRLGLDGAVVTKVDEATSLGGLLSTVIEANLTLCYVADGQRVPEDLKLASRYRAEFVSQAVTLTREHAREQALDHGERPGRSEITAAPNTRETELSRPQLTTTDKRIASYG